MRQLVQNFLNNPTDKDVNGFFGIQPVIVSSLVKIAKILHYRNDTLAIDGGATAFDTKTLNIVLGFVGYKGEPITLTKDSTLIISAPWGRDDVILSITNYGSNKQKVTEYVIEYKDTPQSQKWASSSFFYLDNPLVIIERIFQAYRNREKMQVSTAPFGASRWNRRIFYRMFIEAFNMAVTSESRGVREATSSFISSGDANMKTSPDSSSRTILREMVVKGAYGNNSIFMDFSNIETTRLCLFRVGDEVQSFDPVETTKHSLGFKSTLLYAYNIKSKNFHLNPKFFEEGSPLNIAANVKVDSPSRSIDLIKGKRIPMKTIGSFYLIDSLLSAKSFGDLLEMEEIPEYARPESAFFPEDFNMIDWCCDSMREALKRVSYYPRPERLISPVIKIESSVIEDDEDKVLWIIRIYEMYDLTLEAHVKYDLSKVLVEQKGCSRGVHDGGRIWHLDMDFVKYALYNGFDRLLSETISDLLVLPKSEVIVRRFLADNEIAPVWPQDKVRPTSQMFSEMKLTDDLEQIVIKTKSGLDIGADEDHEMTKVRRQLEYVYTYSKNL